MEHESTKISFSSKGAWIGLLAYLALICLLVVIFMLG